MVAVARKLQPESTPRLSTTLWGIDWSRHFPLALGDSGITVEYTDYDSVLPFIQANFAEIYGGISQGKFTERFDKKAKEQFYRVAGDFFLLRDDKTGEPVGLGMFNPQDWSTYYFRNVSMLPSVQGRGAYQLFFKSIGEVVAQYGVRRIEGDVSPSNLPHIHAVTKLGLYVTGLALSDRWGSMLHFTLFLGEGDKDAFDGHFCEIARALKK